ncbi:type VII secretion protein EccB [Actinoplanes sp. CA-030573]|uniref:type VII secretion protein EccB n=1 Tax=Actinoplanes sp. CA-030573 TaxID=3239898 RepID=UPI003D91FEF5
MRRHHADILPEEPAAARCSVSSIHSRRRMMAWSRKDQIQANQFLRQRSVSALVQAEPDAAHLPSRRPLLGTLAGAIILTLALAAFGVWGLVRPGAADAWQDPGVIIIANETGTRFVRAADERIHPVLNFASARLIVGADNPKSVHVSARSLGEAARGLPVGISGAPDALPAAGKLSGGAWTVCSRAAPRPTPVTTVVLGGEPEGQEPASDTGLLVEDAQKRTYLLADGRRWAIGGSAALAALNYSATLALPVSDGVLNAMPVGPDLRFPPIDNRGKQPRWNAPGGVRVGQVLQSQVVGTTTRLMLVLSDGVRTITATEAALVLGDPAARASYGASPVRPVPVPASALASAPTVVEPVDRGAFPVRPPQLLQLLSPQDVAACAVVQPGEDPVVRLRICAVGALAVRRPVPWNGGSLEVAVPPDTGALVRTNVYGGTTYLVTDQARRFAVADDAARTALGYGAVRPVDLPPDVIGLVPAGPTLDRAAAAKVQQ